MKNNIRLLVIILTINLLAQNTNNITENPSAKIDLIGFESELKNTIHNVFNATGWFAQTSLQTYLLNKIKKNINIRIERKTISLIKIKIKQIGKKESIFQKNIGNLYGYNLATTIVNLVNNKIFGKDQFNYLVSSKIAFSAENENGKRNIYSIHIDGTNLSQKTFNGNASNPTWAKSKKIIFYNTKTSINESLIINNIKNNKRKLFSYYNGINSQAKINPQGDKILFCVDVNGTIDLGIMPIDNNNFKIDYLTNNNDIEFSPTWAKNGINICYAVSKIQDGIITLPKLTIINIKTKEKKELFPNSKIGRYDPNWSNNNNLIAYSKNINENLTITLFDPIKQNKEKSIFIKNINGDWLEPSWAPDGRHLACVNNNNGQRKLYIIDSWLETAKEIPISLKNIETPTWSSSY